MATTSDQTRSQLNIPWSPKSNKASSSSVTDTPGAFPASPSIEPIPKGFSAPQSLVAAVQARKQDYVRKKTIKIKVGTWNVAAISGTEKDLGAWFVHGFGVKGVSQDLSGLSVQPDPSERENIESIEHQEARFSPKKSTVPENDEPAVIRGEEIDLYVLGLQEVVDINSVTEAVRPYTDPNPAKKWKVAMKKSLPDGYQKIAEQQLLGLLILIYASADLASAITSVSATSVGTGLMGYLGNKGAVAVRLVIAETTRLCFINCHLSAGADQASLSRRIWDANQIVSRTKFSPVDSIEGFSKAAEEKIGHEDFAFWFGDLNYRLDDIPGEDVRRLLLLHTRNEYDIENKSKRKIDSELGYIDPPSNESSEETRDELTHRELSAKESDAEPPLDPKSDPASLHTTLQSLLPHDQLRALQKSQRVFHEGWREGDIHFLPTYKYDVGSVGMFDSGEKKRSPSWCDRILYRTKTDLVNYLSTAKKAGDAQKKDDEMKRRGLDKAAAEQDVLFDYDPDADGDGLAYGEEHDDIEHQDKNDITVQTLQRSADTIELHHYISHQRILSSDHKPLEALFTLTYDGVIPELKAQVLQEVARELDKAENEGRPAVTVVMDNISEDGSTDSDNQTDHSDMSCVRFGEVRYKIPKSRHVTIANTGQIEATFSFVDRSAAAEREDVTPSWLSLSKVTSESSSGTTSDQLLAKENPLSPGETITIILTLEVSDPDLVYDLNQDKAQLVDVLVLRVTGGRDFFIPIKAKWMPSSFCRTLDELVQIPPGGVRRLPRSPKNRDSTGAAKLKSSPTHHSAPKELFALTETIPGLVERSMAEWTMTNHEIPPWERKDIGDSWPFQPETWTLAAGEERTSLLEATRETLDNAQPLNERFGPDVSPLVRLEILCETLMLFLQSLRDGPVPSESWSVIEGKFTAAETAKTSLRPEDIQAIVMEALSTEPVHSICLTFLTFTLTRIIQERISNSSSQNSSTDHKRTRTTTQSSEAGSEATIASGEETSSKRSFFSLRRKRAQSAGNSTEDDNSAMDANEKKKAIVSAYAEVYAPLIIRSDRHDQSKSKERRSQDSRKKTVLVSFLETSPG